jgi:twinkle protein
VGELMELIPDTIDFSGYMEEPKAEHRVLPASGWLNDVIDDFYKPDDSPKVRMGWRKTQGDFFFRPAEVTLWAGINGHGKSQMVGQVALDLMSQHERVCIASLELSPRRVMNRMLRQAHGSNPPPIPYIKQFHKWTDERLWLYDHVGSSNPKTILAVIRYAIEKFKVSHFVVDNLAKIVAGEDDYNAQKDFVNGLCTIAHGTGVHIHLVLHVKKGKTENDVPGKFDIKGSGAITDLVDNVFIVWRNKAKEARIREGNATDADEPDAVLVLEKQRNGETEGKYSFWFDPVSFQYVEGRNELSKMYRVETGLTADQVEF